MDLKSDSPSDDGANASPEDLFGIVLKVKAESLVPSREAVFLGHHDSVDGGNFRISILDFVFKRGCLIPRDELSKLHFNLVRHCSDSNTFHFYRQAVFCRLCFDGEVEDSTEAL